MEPHEIITLVNEYFKVDVMVHKKHARISNSRYIAIVLIKKHCSLTHSQIGRLFKMHRNAAVIAEEQLKRYFISDLKLKTQFLDISSKVALIELQRLENRGYTWDIEPKNAVKKVA